MNYIKALELLYDRLSTTKLSTTAIAMVLSLIHIANRICFSKKSFPVSLGELEYITQAKLTRIIEARNSLVNAGLILWTTKNNGEAARYELIFFEPTHPDNTISYITLLENVYGAILPTQQLSTPAIAILLAMFHLFNANKYPDNLSIPRTTLLVITSLPLSTLNNNINKLLDMELIKRTNRTGNQSSIYQLGDLLKNIEGETQIETQSETQVETHTKTQTETQTQCIHKQHNSNQCNIRESTSLPIPTLEEIKNYAQSQGYNNVDALENFFSYYESVGWVKKGAPIVKWTSALDKWMRDEKKYHLQHNASQGCKNKNQFLNYTNSTDKKVADEFEKLFLVEANKPS